MQEPTYFLAEEIFLEFSEIFLEFSEIEEEKSFWGRFEQWIDDHCECKGRLLVPIVGIKAGLVRNKG